MRRNVVALVLAVALLGAVCWAPASARTTTVHKRSVTLQVRKGNYPARFGGGEVKARDGFTTCVQRVPIVLWDKTVKVWHGETNDKGHYSATFRSDDRLGLRVVAPEVRRGADTCSRAVGHD